MIFGEGHLFPDRESARADITSIQKSVSSLPDETLRHILEEIFTYDRESFDRSRNSLILELAGRLQIDPARLDYTAQSLAAIDHSITASGGPPLLIDELFPHAIAYTGELIIHWTGWKWNLIENPIIPGIWEPFLQRNNGQNIKFYHLLYKTTYEEDAVACLSVTRHTLLFHGSISLEQA